MSTSVWWSCHPQLQLISDLIYSVEPAFKKTAATWKLEFKYSPEGTFSKDHQTPGLRIPKVLTGKIENQKPVHLFKFLAHSLPPFLSLRSCQTSVSLSLSLWDGDLLPSDALTWLEMWILLILVFGYSSIIIAFCPLKSRRTRDEERAKDDLPPDSGLAQIGRRCSRSWNIGQQVQVPRGSLDAMVLPTSVARGFRSSLSLREGSSGWVRR